MSIFHRIWTGIVAAVTGAAIALLIQIAAMMTVGLPVDWLMWLLIGCSSLGFLFGMLVGPRETKKSDKPNVP